MTWFRRTGAEAHDRRRGGDRRATHVLLTDWRWAINGRRRVGRRGDESAESGVDIYEPSIGLVALAVFLLSCLDAAFTLTLIWGNLGVELNPLMRLLLSHDAQIFVNLKIVFTGAGVVFLVALAEARFMRVVRVRMILYTLLLTYAGIVSYEIANLGLYVLHP